VRAPDSEIRFWLGEACAALGEPELAVGHWLRAATPVAWTLCEATLYQAMALRRLNQPDQAERLLRDLLAEGQRLEQMPAQIEYFATSLPTMLLFEDDLQRRQTVDALLLKAHAQAGLGRRDLANQLLARMAELDPSRAVETTSLVR
jgi:hypothetical protein